MWHAARENERKVKGLVIDHKKRAERRRARSALLQSDPFQQLRVNGQQLTLHIDPYERKKVEDGSKLMPWAADGETMIDRFDVRIHLDFIREPRSDITTRSLEAADTEMQENLNFERYRDLIHAKRIGASEQLHLASVEYHDEQRSEKNRAFNVDRGKTDNNAVVDVKKAAIGFDYGTNTTSAEQSVTQNSEDLESKPIDKMEVFDMVCSTEVYADIRHDGDRLQANKIASTEFGVTNYVRLLRKEQQEVERIKAQKEAEASGMSNLSNHPGSGKGMMGGSMAVGAAPAYARRKSPTYEKPNQSDMAGRSDSDENRPRPTSRGSRSVREYKGTVGVALVAAAAPKKLTPLERMKLKRQKKLEQNFEADKQKQEDKAEESKKIKREREGFFRRSRSPLPYSSRTDRSSRSRSYSRSSRSRSLSRSRSRSSDRYHSNRRSRSRSRGYRNRKTSRRNRTRIEKRSRRSRSLTSSRSRSRSRSMGRGQTRDCSRRRRTRSRSRSISLRRSNSRSKSRSRSQTPSKSR